MKLNRSSWDFQDYSQGEQSKKEEDVEFPLHETGIPIIVPVQKLTGDSTVPEYLKFDIEMEDYIKETGQVVHGIYSTQIDLGSSARVFATTSALILGQQDQGSNRYSQNTRPVIKVSDPYIFSIKTNLLLSKTTGRSQKVRRGNTLQTV